MAVTLGDPAGIGPEVTIKALRRLRTASSVRFLLIADSVRHRRYRDRTPSFCRWVLLDEDGRGVRAGRSDEVSARIALASLEKAVRLLREGGARALVTAPLCKESIVRAGCPGFHGHTEYLAAAFGSPDVEMMFVSRAMRVILVTRHIPLRRVPSAITGARVLSVLRSADEALKRLFGIRTPRLAVCGLNPHAGEGGGIGTEEIRVIGPALRAARRRGILVEGPFAADTLFTPRRRASFDAVVAMYHDQGLLPIKTLGLGDVVNLTVGLPFIRTSPAHGTAFDIAGKGRASPDSMRAALDLAVSLARRP